MPVRAAQVSMSAFNSACADATVTPSFSRPMRERLWLLRARRSSPVKPSGSQISVWVSMRSAPRAITPTT